MPSNKVKIYDVAEELKQVYGVNKNISNNLSQEQRKELLSLLENNETVLALTKAFVAKNNELSNNNRKFGKQREKANRNLQDEQEKNNQLNTEVSQLKYELKELRKQLVNVLDRFHGMLTKDILKRSEILLFVENLRDSFQNSNQKRK